MYQSTVDVPRPRRATSDEEIPSLNKLLWSKHLATYLTHIVNSIFIIEYILSSNVDSRDKRTPFCLNRLSLSGGSMYSEAFLYALCIKLRILSYKYSF